MEKKNLINKKYFDKIVFFSIYCFDTRNDASFTFVGLHFYVPFLLVL